MTDSELDNLIDASWIEPCWLDIASEWHGGQWSMLYAIASTGSLTLGSVRPNVWDDDTDEERPATDAEWYRSLLSDLSRELDLVLRAMEGVYPQTERYDYHDVLAFRDAVDSRISRMDSAESK